MSQSTPPEVHSSWEKRTSQPMHHRRVGTPMVGRSTETQHATQSSRHWLQADISRAPWCLSMWTQTRRIRKGRSSIHANHTSLPSVACVTAGISLSPPALKSCYCHLTDTETGLPRLKNSPLTKQVTSFLEVCECDKGRCEHVTSTSKGKPETWKGDQWCQENLGLPRWRLHL